jgi:hypothetical protein
MNKRIISGVAALALVFSSAVPAFAAENISAEDGDFYFEFDGINDDDDASFDDGSNETATTGSDTTTIVVGKGDTTVPIYDTEEKKDDVKEEAPVEEAPKEETVKEDTTTVVTPKDTTPKNAPKTTYGGFGGNFGSGNYTTYGAYLPYTPTNKDDADKIFVNYGDGITEVVTPGSTEADRIFGAKEDADSTNKNVQFVSASPFTPWLKVPVVTPKDGDKPDYISYGYYSNPETDENGRVVNNNWGWGWFGNYWLNNMPVPTYTATNYFGWFTGVPSDKDVVYYTTKDGESAPKFEFKWFGPKKAWNVPTANWFAPQNYWFGFNNFKAPKKATKCSAKKAKKAKAKKAAPVVKVVEKTVYVPVYTPVNNWFNTAFKPVKVDKKKAAAPKFSFTNFNFGKNFAAPQFNTWTNVFKGFIPAPHQ